MANKDYGDNYPVLEEERVIVIHEVTDKIILLLRHKIKKTDILCFDDGLYSNYKYLSELIKFPNKKIFFYSTAIVRPDSMRPNDKNINCHTAHKLFTNNNNFALSFYMSEEELREIDGAPNCSVQVHGHKHIKIIGKVVPKKLLIFNIEYLGTSKELLDILKDDIQYMFQEYYNLFRKLPEAYCFPYNIENPFLRSILIMEYKRTHEKLNINQTTEIKLYGNKRIDINE